MPEPPTLAPFSTAYGNADTQLGIAGASAGTVQAGRLDQLASQPGLVVTPDNPVALDAPGGVSVGGGGKPGAGAEIWPKAVGVDQLWPQEGKASEGRPRVSGPAPAIAFVDSGIEAGRADFGDRILAQVNLSGLPNNSPGTGSATARSSPGSRRAPPRKYPGAAPTPGTSPST